MSYWIIIILFVVNGLLCGHFHKKQQTIPTYLVSINMVLCLLVFLLTLGYEAEKNQILFYLSFIIGAVILMNLLYLNNEQPPAKKLVVAHPPMSTQTSVITSNYIHLNPSKEKQGFNHKLYNIRQSIREIKQEEKSFWTNQISSTQLNDYKKRFQNIQNQIRALHKECSDHVGLCTSIDHNAPNDQIIHIKLIIKVLEKLKHDLEFFEAQFDKKYGEWVQQEYKVKLELLDELKKQTILSQQRYDETKQKLDYMVNNLWEIYQKKYPGVTTQQLVNYARDSEPNTVKQIKKQEEKLKYLKYDYISDKEAVKIAQQEIIHWKRMLNPLHINEESIYQLWQTYTPDEDNEEFWQAYEQRLQTLDGWRQAVYLFKA